MSIIKARPNRVRSVRYICRLQDLNRDTLVFYSRFIGGAVDHVLEQLIETSLMKDLDVMTWRQEVPDEGVASASRRPVRITRAATSSGGCEVGTMRRVVESRIVLSRSLSALSNTRVAAGGDVLISHGTSTSRAAILNARAIVLSPDDRIVADEDCVPAGAVDANGKCRARAARMATAHDEATLQ